MKKIDVKFERVSESALLGKTKRGIGGFGSTKKLLHYQSQAKFLLCQIIVMIVMTNFCNV